MPDAPRKMGPLAADHHLLNGDECAACKKPFWVGDYVTLVPLGPGDDEDERRRARQGQHYNAVAAVVHWDCADWRVY